MSDPTVRPATPADASAMAELVDMAGEGLPFYLWSKLAEQGEDPWAVGRQRAARESGSFSYRNAFMLADDGDILGCLVGYRLPEAPEPIDYDTMPPMFIPLQELENLASSAWYVNVLAVYPEHRGRGYGSRLLRQAEEAAAESRADSLAIIVSDGNPGARRLYERHGYRPAAERPMVTEDWINSGRNWLLLRKDRP